MDTLLHSVRILNAERLMDSAARLEMPQLQEQFIDAVIRWLELMQDVWIRSYIVYSSYMFGINPVIGVLKLRQMNYQFRMFCTR